MGLLSLIFGEVNARIGLVELDASLSETHSVNAEVVTHPIEDGSDITDHIRKQPESIQISGLVSNTPLVFLASLQQPSPIVNDVKSVKDRVEVAYQELQRIMREGELVDVVTSLRPYENMALTSLSITRDVANGNVLNASLGLQQVIVVKGEPDSDTTPEGTGTKPPKNDGTKSTRPASGPQGSQATGLVGAA